MLTSFAAFAPAGRPFVPAAQLFVTCLRRLRLFAASGGGKTKNKAV